jgi:hypothetical protein
VKNRLDTIREIADTQYTRELPFDDVRDAAYFPLLLCLSDDELIQLFWEYIRGNNSLSRVQGMIGRRIDENGSGAYLGLVDGIYALFPTAHWNQYQRLRKFLASIIRAFPVTEQRKYFDYFFADRRGYDRGKAIAIAGQIWGEDIEKKMWDCFLTDLDDRCLRLLIERADIDKFAKSFKDIWRNPHIQFGRKVELLRRLASQHFRSLSFLKKVSPLSYLHAVVLARKTFPRKEALRLALASKDSRELGFSMWCLGKLGFWAELTLLDKRLPRIQKQFDAARLQKYGITDVEEFEETTMFGLRYLL